MIGVTRFFRDREAFDALEKAILPRLFELAGDQPVRVWVPGCASGQEAYSVAIQLSHHARRLAEPSSVLPRIQVFATDINEAALAVARVGRYPATIASEVPPEWLEQYFVAEEGGYSVTREIRDACIFSVHDVPHLVSVRGCPVQRQLVRSKLAVARGARVEPPRTLSHPEGRTPLVRSRPDPPSAPSVGPCPARSGSRRAGRPRVEVAVAPGSEGRPELGERVSQLVRSGVRGGEPSASASRSTGFVKWCAKPEALVRILSPSLQETSASTGEPTQKRLQEEIDRLVAAFAAVWGTPRA
jgi:hypothetical protein